MNVKLVESRYLKNSGGSRRLWLVQPESEEPYYIVGWDLSCDEVVARHFEEDLDFPSASYARMRFSHSQLQEAIDYCRY